MPSFEEKLFAVIWFINAMMVFAIGFDEFVAVVVLEFELDAEKVLKIDRPVFATPIYVKFRLRIEKNMLDSLILEEQVSKNL